MLTYEPGDSLAHGLDPRAKLLFQFGFAVAAFTVPVPALAALFALGVGCLLAARLSIARALRAYWLVLVILGAGPVIAGLTLGPPWFRVEPALASLRSVARVVPVLLVSAAYVHATPVRDTRAAIQRSIPGRAGQLFGVGVALTFRFVPVVRADVDRIRDAIRARGGDRRSFRDRASRLATLSLVRALRRADRLSLALQARCFAYNPTLPALSFRWRDYLVVALAVGVIVAGVAS